ncbi:MAG: PAS domain-containing protein [Bacteroidota bacterium]|nr:PAS domain-containing protein [Kiloniellaceae bacterium]
MGSRSPRPCDPARSAPVFDRTTTLRFGTIRIRRFHPEADAACFAGLAPVVRIWQARCRDGALPRWKDFAMEDFRGWHRQLALSDITANGDLYFRLFGSGAVELMGGDLTGKKLTDYFPAAGQDGVLAHLIALRDGRQIGYLTTNLPIPGLEHRTFDVVELPLGNDGDEVSQLLHAFRDLRSDE